MLVSHKNSVQIDATFDQFEALSRTSKVIYFSVLEDNHPVGLIHRIDQPEEPESKSKPKTGLLQKFQRSKKEANAQPAGWTLRDAMIADPLIIEYGTDHDLLFETTFGRSDKRLNEDIILTNVGGTYFGNIQANAVMRLLHGFLGKHMQELRSQKQTLMLQHSQVVKVRRDLELTNEKLEVSRDQALEGVRMKNQFLANMSHEIRTPMNGVFGMIDLLYDTPLDNDQETLVTTARSSAETLMRIINDILDFSKIEAGKVSVETMPFNIVEIVEASAALYTETATEKELNLSVNFDNAPAWVIGDPHRYQQILNNLISNALKFTDTGSVEIYLTQVSTEHGLGILTEVKDTGIGIQASKIATLFQPFTQADESHQRKYGGTGLGLSICKNLVELLQGALDCESTVGKGTVFSFSVPFAPHLEQGTASPSSISQKMQCNAAGPSRRMDFSGMRVLLVEDNLVNQEVARRLLLKLNAKVTCAENGQIALKYLADAQFDCVFMDCQMPVMDGYESTLQIRDGAAGEKMRDVFISAVTAHVMMEERTRCLSIGMDHYFSKPSGLKDFRLALELANEKIEKNKNAPIPMSTRN